MRLQILTQYLAVVNGLRRANTHMHLPSIHFIGFGLRHSCRQFEIVFAFLAFAIEEKNKSPPYVLGVH